MEPGHIPDHKATPTPAEVRYIRSNTFGVNGVLFNIAIKNDATSPKIKRWRTGLEYLEIVQSIDIPLGWVQDTSESELSIPGRVVCKYYSPGDTSVWIGLSTQAMSERPDDECAKFFCKTLAEPLHILQPIEIKQLAGVLETLANSKEFKVIDGRTVDWNGKRAVLIEGHWISEPRPGKVLIGGQWIEDSPRDEFSLFVDVRGDGLDPLNICFSAPSDKYSQLSPQGKAAIKSIKWKARNGTKSK